MMNMIQTRALVFDAYGTLFDVSSLREACAVVTGDADGFAGLWRSKQLEYSRLRSLMRRYEDWQVITQSALRHTVAAYGVALTLAQEAALMDAWYAVTPFPDVEPALRTLANRGLTLAILSNGTPEMLTRLVKNTGLNSYFNRLLSVDQVKVYKPDPATYALPERELGLPREVLLFISSNFWDVAGARAFGLRVCWINRVGAPPDELGYAPTHQFGNLEQLPALL
jgi:2-haloacid dehalogenase